MNGASCPVCSTLPEHTFHRFMVTKRVLLRNALINIPFVFRSSSLSNIIRFEFQLPVTGRNIASNDAKLCSIRGSICIGHEYYLKMFNLFMFAFAGFFVSCDVVHCVSHLLLGENEKWFQFYLLLHNFSFGFISFFLMRFTCRVVIARWNATCSLFSHIFIIFSCICSAAAIDAESLSGDEIRVHCSSIFFLY